MPCSKPSRAASTEASPAASTARSDGGCILITGAGGEVGHGLIHALHAGGCNNIVAMDLRELPQQQRSCCREMVVGDIRDLDLLTRVLAEHPVAVIYHLAALLSTRAETDPEAAHDVNVNGTINLLHLAADQAHRTGRAVKFLFPSTIAVYGMADVQTKQRAGAVTEDQHLTPITMYGCNKLYCEHLGRYFSQHYRQLSNDHNGSPIDFRCLRYPGIISADTLPTGGTSDFAPEMIHAAANDQPYACFVRPDARIPFMTMPDAIDALLKLAAAERSSLTRCVYNVGSFNPSAGEMADLVQAEFPAAQIIFQPHAARQAIIDSWPADVDDAAARRDWGYAPQHDLHRAFAEYLVPRIAARAVAGD